MSGFFADSIWSNLAHLVAAYLLAFPIGWEREAHARSAGLRTFPLVAVATCGFMLVGIGVLDSTDAESRIMEAVITGIGFVGGGAILKGHDRVVGTATAVSLWTTAAIGLAVAWDRFEIAILLAALNIVTLQIGTPLKLLIRKGEYKHPPDQS